MSRAGSPWVLLGIEALAVAAAFLVAALVRQRRPRRPGRASAVAAWLAVSPRAEAAVFCATLAGQLLVLPLFGIPDPNLHDEFGNLLAAETFSLGRLTNPPHPFWPHFETFHVLQQPTYMAMQMPGQGLLLAAAIVSGVPPIVAVWLSVAAAGASVCWAARAFAPPRWALLGGLLFAARLGVLSYWSWSYWGGAVAAVGGALVLGGAGRLARRQGAFPGIPLGAGAALLLLTRPFEGLGVALPAAGLVLARLAAPGRGPSRKELVARVALPASLLLATAVAFVAAENAAVTGSARVFPYALQRETYAVSRHLVGQPDRPAPSYRHAVMRDFYTQWEPENFGRFALGRGPVRDLAATARKLVPIFTFFVGPALLPAFVLLPAVLLRRKNRVLALSLLGSLATFLFVSWWIVPHYAAPATAALWIASLEGLRRLRILARRLGRVPAGPVVAVVVTVAIAFAARLAAPTLGLSVAAWPPAWYSTVRFQDFTRAALDSELRARGGRHLVFVRYAPGHSPHLEWVFNGADLAGAPVLWARSMGGAADAALARHEAGRSVWLLEPDADPYRLVPYAPR